MTDLLQINVNDHTEKKGQLTYLSWAWAWAEVLKVDPAATWVVHSYGPQGAEQPCMWIGETAIVHTSVTINELRRECMLPVMDNKNNAVKLPDARKISDAIMRCMTKAVAMHGLGLYIYAGEDIPEGDAPDHAETDSPKQSRPVASPKAGAHAETLATSPPISKEWKTWLDEFSERVCTIFDANGDDGPKAAWELIEKEKLEDTQLIYLSSVLPSGVRNPIKDYSHAAHSPKKKEPAKA